MKDGWDEEPMIISRTLEEPLFTVQLDSLYRLKPVKDWETLHRT